MFFVPRVNVVESDAGFSIEILGRTGMKYREGEKSLFVDSEVLVQGKGIAISSKSIREWDPPYTASPISPEKRDAIINNIRQAMEYQNEPLEVL
ncbi:MAG: Imm74 family immunity protein [Candidatus Sulfotelmatobacter sp.]|jgi:hypothetical protein